MPTYSFRNKETNECFDQFMSVNELDQFLEDNSHLEKLLSAPMFLGTNMNGGLRNNKFYDPKDNANA